MSKKETGDLREELMSQADLDAYLSENEDCLTDGEISPQLAALYQSKHISKAELARKAGISEVYLHQVFSGKRRPSRDRLLCICVSLCASLEETQELLRKTGYAQLYPRIRRDAILIYGILHGISLDKINLQLFNKGEKTLF